MKTLDIVVRPDGSFTMIHDDAYTLAMQADGDLTLSASRASHVEPETADGRVQWFADLSPVKGPKLGPFPTRDQALCEEVAWLRAHLLLCDTCRIKQDADAEKAKRADEIDQAFAAIADEPHPFDDDPVIWG